MLVDGFTLTNPVQAGIKRDATLLIGGALSVNEDSIGWRTHAKIDLDRILVSLAVPSQGASVKFFLKKNGEKLTALPIEIPAGTDFLEVPLYDLYSTTADAGDYFNIEVLQVGSTVSGSNLRVQINKSISSNAMSGDVYDLDMEYYAELLMTNGVERRLVSGEDIEFAGCYAYSGGYSIGSISGVIRNGFNVEGLFAYKNFTTGNIRMSLRVDGAGLAKEFFRSVYVEGLGHFLTSDSTHSDAENNNLTQWYWNITDDMFNVLKNASTTGVRISRTIELDYTDAYVIPSRYITSLRDRIGFRETMFNDGSNPYPTADNKKGILLNKSTLPANLTVLEFYSNADNTNLGATTDGFRVFVPGDVAAGSEFGCIRFPDFGNFAMSCRNSRTYSASNNATVYGWGVRKEQPFTSPKTALDFGNRNITVDMSKPAFNRSYTAGTVTVSTKIYRGWRSGGTGASGTVLGSISSTSVSGKTLCELMFLSDTAHVWKYMVYLRYTQNNLTSSAVNFVEFDLIGRFYGDEANVWQQPTFTQFAWPISQDKFNAAPVGSPHKMFYLV